MTFPSRLMRIVLLLVILAYALPSRGAAQSGIEESSAAHGVRLHVGMWTTHLSDLDRGLDTNWLLAVAVRGLDGGTFVNSFGKRAFTAGIERSLARSEDGTVAAGLDRAERCQPIGH